MTEHAVDSGKTGKDESQGKSKFTLLMPLYIYPLSVASWARLYDSMGTYPNLSFCIVANPNSGPGTEPLPGKDYGREIPKLNAYENCQTIGYVRIDYCRRPVADVYKDITMYSEWPALSNGLLYVEGIFLDETPNHYSEEKLEYLRAVRQYIRDQGGIKGSRFIVENPGTPPDIELAGDESNVIVTCELPYDRLISDEVQGYYRIKELERAKTCYMVSGVPVGQMKDVVHRIRAKAAYIYATDLREQVYESFGPSWDVFLAALNE